MAELWLLGPVQLWVAGQAVELGPPRQRGVLCALAYQPNQPVSLSALVERIWDHAPPAHARDVLYTHLSAIRRTLREANGTDAEAVTLLRRGGGYLLNIDPDRVDAHRFRRLVEQARDPHTPHTAEAALLREALDLWHGPPLADLNSTWAAQVRHAWATQRLAAARLWAEIELQAGHSRPVIEQLLVLTAEHPLAEPLLALLMRALHADGCDAEALDQYAAARRRLAEELGVDPGSELRDVHQGILQGTLPPPSPAIGKHSTVPAPAELRPVSTAASRPPAQLPADAHAFTGRTNELAELDRLLDAGPTGNGRSTAPVISAISGTAGVGKTALAVHWAHRVRASFPDGQLYVNLRGFDPTGPAATPGEAVRGFLTALQVPAERIPLSLDAQTALYRSMLDGKRMLVVLDNARDAEQARPLLPGTPTAVAIVTSRNRLTSLVAAHGARPLMLDLLGPDEARELLARRLGARLVAAEPQAVEQIIARCAGLPLALAIAAARAAESEFPLAALAAELADAERVLDALDAGDPVAQVRAVFSWSYAALTPAAARVFRLLAVHPGPDISIPAAASLADLPNTRTRHVLDELTRANLVAERVPGRYSCHDLLRAYAADLADSLEPADQRHAAVCRVVDHYLHTANAADRILDPHRDPIPLALAPPAPGVAPEHFAGNEQATAWLAAEHSVLLAAVRQAAGAGLHSRTWQLAWILRTFLERQGHWHDVVGTFRAALHAARQLDDVPALAFAHRQLALAHAWLGSYGEAHAHHSEALELFVRAGDLAGQAHSHSSLAVEWDRQQRPDLALDHAQRSLTLFRAIGHRRGQAFGLNMIGWYHILLGDYRQALAGCQQALAMFQQHGDPEGEAAAWDSLGYAHHHLGHHQDAADCYRHALDLLHHLGSRFYEADTLTRLGDTHHAAGDRVAARAAWAHALDILTELEHPDADGVRAKLDDVGHGRPGSS